MIAVNLNTKRIYFSNGLSELEKYRLTKTLWFQSDVLNRETFPLLATGTAANGITLTEQNGWEVQHGDD